MLFSPQPRTMWLALLLLPTALRLSLAGGLQESDPLCRLTQQGTWGSGTSNATGSPCGGLFLIGTTTLTLENRSLKHLPGCLPRALRSLDGSHNLLSALSASELGHLPQLQVLTLRHNRICALSWGPGWPAELHTLDLSYNQLVALPPCARPALGSLRELELSGNPLQRVQPGAFDCFPALRLLNLSDTALGSGAQVGIADTAFAPLATLEVLDLSGTLLKQGESCAPRVFRGGLGMGSRDRLLRGVVTQVPRSQCGAKIARPKFPEPSAPRSKPHPGVVHSLNPKRWNYYLGFAYEEINAQKGE